MINYLALLTALAVSAVAAIFSIIGLTAIFSGAYWPIVIMGTVLEIGKVVTASWLYRNWKYTSKFIKYYLTICVIVLMFITSMGIFGYLSKAHIEQQLILNSGVADEISIMENKITLDSETIIDYNIRIDQIDLAIKAIRDSKNPRDSLTYAKKYSEDREVLIQKKFEKEQQINELKTKKLRLDSEHRKLEAEVGPIKYIANVVYGEADPSQLEKSVRWVIIILVCVFDPLAIVLLIAANSGFVRQSRLKKKRTRTPRAKPKQRGDKNIIEVHKSNMKEM